MLDICIPAVRKKKQIRTHTLLRQGSVLIYTIVSS